MFDRESMLSAPATAALNMLSAGSLLTLQGKIRKLLNAWLFDEIPIWNSKMESEAAENCISRKERQLGDKALFEDKLTSYKNTHWLPSCPTENLLLFSEEAIRYAKTPGEKTMNFSKLESWPSTTSSPSDGLVLVTFANLFQKAKNCYESLEEENLRAFAKTYNLLRSMAETNLHFQDVFGVLNLTGLLEVG